MRRGVEMLREQNVSYFDGLLKIALAETEAWAGDSDRAVAILDEALATCNRTGYRAFEAELHRARGEMLLKRDRVNPAPAEEAFQTAIAVAKRQGTRELRTTRGACARETLSINQPFRRRQLYARSRPRRFRADARNARDRRGADAVGSYRGRRTCEARINAVVGWLSCHPE